MKPLFASSFSSLLLCLFVYLAQFYSIKALVKLPPNMTVPAVYVFGDSIVDAGMNNYINTLIRCDYLPYGIDFEGGKPTGGFCDGKIPSDIIGEELGIKNIVPAYLEPNLQPQDLITGVTFASGGAGYDPLTAKIVSALPLQDQVDYSKEYVGKLKGIVGEERANFIIANSLFLIVAGSDDIANTYFPLPVRKKQYDVPSYTELLANAASDTFMQLYQLGARRIAAFSAPPIGCVPAQRTVAGGIGRGCAEDYNAAARLFNTKLSKTMESLTHQYSPDAKFVFIDVYNPLLDLINKPNKSGFEVSDKGCCGTGLIEVIILCNQKTTTVCPDISKYVFWDSFHPTETAYRALISPLIQKYVTKFL